ncbi:MAG: PEP-CTERM sorting domain-containing protein, partial [Planctomycetota bacterium]|jgi:hypothetical protein
MMKRYSALIAVFVLLAQCCSAPAALTLADGGHHVLDYTVNTVVKVDRDAPGVGTTVDLIDGGTVEAWIDAYEDGWVNILGGRVGGAVKAYDRVQCRISGGEIGGPVFARDDSWMEISGGSMESWVHASDNSWVAITGGEFALFIEAWENSRIYISGGIIAGEIGAVGNDSFITIDGSDFVVNGTPVGNDSYVRFYGTMGTITGTLANGDALETTYKLIHPGATIKLIPEPATVLLLGLGGLGLLRRRK